MSYDTRSRCKRKRLLTSFSSSVDVFFEYIKRCENTFQELFDLHAHAAGLLQTIAQAVMDVQLQVLNRYAIIYGD